MDASMSESSAKNGANGLQHSQRQPHALAHDDYFNISPPRDAAAARELFQLPPLSHMFGPDGALPASEAAASGPQRRSPLLPHAIIGAAAAEAVHEKGNNAGRSLSPHPYQMARDGRRSPVSASSHSPASISSYMGPPSIGSAHYGSYRSTSMPSTTGAESMGMPSEMGLRHSASFTDGWPFAPFDADSYFPPMQRPPTISNPSLLHSYTAPPGELPTLRYPQTPADDLNEPLRSAPLLGRDQMGSGEIKEIKARKPHKKKPQPPGCAACGATATPEWRRGPTGSRTLCNACGLQGQKLWKGYADDHDGQQEQLRVLGDARRARAERMAVGGIHLTLGVQDGAEDGRPLPQPLQIRTLQSVSMPHIQVAPSPLMTRPLLPLPLPSLPLPRSPAEEAAVQQRRSDEEEAAARSLSSMSLPPSYHPPPWAQQSAAHQRPPFSYASSVPEPHLHYDYVKRS